MENTTEMDQENNVEVENEVEKEVVMSDLDMMLMSVGEELKSTKKVFNSNNNTNNNSSSDNNSSSSNNNTNNNSNINSNNKNNISSKNNENNSAYLDTPGAIWTSGVGRRKRCRHSIRCKKEGGERGSEGGDGIECGEECTMKTENDTLNSNSNSNDNGQEEVERNRDRKEKKTKEDVIEMMREGTLDPSRNLPKNAYQIATHTTDNEVDEKIRHENNYGNNNNNNNYNNNNDTTNSKKLKRMLQLLLLADELRINENGEKRKWFESVKLNTDFTKLIFRSFERQGSEAFCFIIWGDKNNNENNNSEGEGKNNDNSNNNNDENNDQHNIDENTENKDENNMKMNHSAVVQCEDEIFRKTVIQALQLIQ